MNLKNYAKWSLKQEYVHIILFIWSSRVGKFKIKKITVVASGNMHWQEKGTEYFWVREISWYGYVLHSYAHAYVCMHTQLYACIKTHWILHYDLYVSLNYT